MGASISLSCTIGEQSIANNTTSVTVVATLKWTNGTWNNSKMSGALIIDGTSYGFTANFNWNGASTSGSVELIRQTVTIKHGDDGNKKLAYEAWFEYHSGKVVEAYGEKTLPFIARTSQPSCITWPEHTQNVGFFGDTISIHTNRAASSLTHTLRYLFGSQSGTIATGVGTGTTWKIPLDLMNVIPNATSGSGTIYCDTYSDSTLIGTASCVFTVEVPDSIKPSCSLSLDDVEKIDEIYGSPVQGLSRIKVTVSATTAYSSPIAAYTIEANGVTYTGAEATTGILKNSGSSPVKVTVRDKRGRTASASYTMSVQAYTAPTVSKMSIKRCNADGTENDKGTHIQVTFSAAVSSMSAKNTAAYALRYKKSTDETYTTVNFSTLANKYAVTNQTYLFAADSEYSYAIEVTATDRHSTATRATSGSTAFTLMDWKASGTGIAFGKVAEKDNTMEIALDTEIHGTSILRGNRYSFSPTRDDSEGYFLVARIAITSNNANSPITFVFSQRQKATTMTVFVQFSSSSATASELGTIWYSGTNYGAFLVPTGSLTWDLYIQKSSSTDIITLQEWYTSKQMEGRLDVTFPGTFSSTLPQPYYRATPAMMQSLLDYLYPVGIVVTLYSQVSPAELFGGTWTRIENRFLWGTTEGGIIGQTGGAQTHTLTVDEMPSHNHEMYSPPVNVRMTGGSGDYWPIQYSATGSNYALMADTGGDAAHNNMPPYIQVSIWRRIA